MATVKKGAKINFYKFVDPDGGKTGGGEIGVKRSRKNVQLTKTIKLQTVATNNLGATVNSLGKVVQDIKRSQLSLLEAERQNAKKKFKPIFDKPQKIKKFAGFDSLFKGKIPSFWESLLNLIGSFLKFFLVLPALKWLANPENQDKVVSILETLHKVFKFISGWAKFSINNTINGLYDLLKDEATIQERIGGLFKALAGLGAAFLGISILTNPLGTVKAFASVLTSFNTGLVTAAVKLARHPLVLGALAIGALSFGAYELIGRDLGEARVEADNTKRKKLEEEGNLDAGEIEALIEGSRIPDVGGSGSTNNLNNMFTDPLGIRNDPLGTGDFIREFSVGGYLNGYAKGGWISGPQSGYPVSLDGNKPDFIGHGTEYVARRSDGGAFVVPFDTPATRKMPGLVNHRLAEAASQGFFDGGGKVSMSPNQRKALNILAKYESLGTGGYNAVNQWGSPDGTGNKYVFPDGSTSFAGDFRNMKVHGGKALTELTVKEILALQKDDGSLSMREWVDQGKLHAVGRYQFVGNTLPGLVERTNVPMDGLFDKKMQDILALQLMKERGISPWIGPSNKATEAERALIELARKDKIPGYSVSGNSGSYKRKSSPSFLGSLFNLLTGTQPAYAGEGLFDEMNKDKKGPTIASNLGSLTVVPASHKDSGTGWGVSGVGDKHGRPIVLSQPAATGFLKMIRDSKGQVNGADVASSGRSIKKNAAVGGHPNSVHLYGEGLDVSGATHKWMLKNGIKYGWKYKYSHGPGSGHYDYVGVGAGKTPILSPFGSGKSFPFSSTVKSDPGGGRPLVGITEGNGLASILQKSGLRENLMDAFGDGKLFAMSGDGLLGDYGFGDNLQIGTGTNYFNSGSMKRKGTSYEEQARVRRVTEQRNAARREINNRTSEIVQMALAAVESSNGNNRQFIQTAEAGIRQLLGAQAGGGTFANVGGTTGTVLRTAVAVLNSFNNPLRGIFS